MSKPKSFSNLVFQTANTNTLSNAFNLAPQVNNFNAIFDTKPLDEKESRGLEKLLVDNFLPGRISEEQVTKDLENLKNITAEIKAIGRQGTILMGERIEKARDLLKPYRDGAFTQWIESAFGSKRTAYNMLSYYQLYSDLPNYSLKERFKKLPQKIAYLLASKEADIDDKAKIIEDYYDSSSDELMLLIQERFPSDQGDGRRKAANKTLLDSLEIGLKKVLRRKDSLTDNNFDQVIKLRKLIDEIMLGKTIAVAPEPR
jgi:Uncharacterised protein family (UPF0137)